MPELPAILTSEYQRWADAAPSCEVSIALCRLRTYPVATFLDSSLWPTAQDLAQAEQQLLMSWREWLARRASESDESWQSALQQVPSSSAIQAPGSTRALRWFLQKARWPFPVGKGAYPFGDDDPLGRFLSPVKCLMPFDGQAQASLIVEAMVAETRMTMFFMLEARTEVVMWEGDTLGDRSEKVPSGEVKRLVHGDPDHEDVVRLFHAAQDWWNAVAGKPAGPKHPGRPKGSGEITQEWVYRALHACRAQNGAWPERQIDFVNQVRDLAGSEGRDITPSQLSRALKKWHKRWEEILFDMRLY